MLSIQFSGTVLCMADYFTGHIGLDLLNDGGNYVLPPIAEYFSWQ